MSERAKFLGGLPTNKVMKPVLLTEKERRALAHYLENSNLSSGLTQEEEYRLFQKLK